MSIWDPGRRYVANATALCPGLIYCCPCRGERKTQCKSCDENHLQHKLNTKVALSNYPLPLLFVATAVSGTSSQGLTHSPQLSKYLP